MLHQTLQQILKLISFYTATDPGSFFSFASCPIDNGLQPNKTSIGRCFSLSTSFTGSGIHAAVHSPKCFSCIVWCMIALFWLKIRLLALQTFAAVRAFLCVPLYHSCLDPSQFSLALSFKNYPELFLHFFCEKFMSILLPT